MNTLVSAALANHRVRTEIEAALQEMLDDHSAKVAQYGTEFSELWSLISQQMRDGKLLRPLIMLETFDAIRTGEATVQHGFEDSALLSCKRIEVLRLAAAIETLHFAFLLHDDVIDEDTMRRGKQNLIGEFTSSALGLDQAVDGATARHWGESAAILAGDLLISAAHQVFARTELPHDTRTRLLDLLEHTVFETVAGELVDVGLSDGIIAPTLSSVLAMTTRKTATYTFELPLRAAAIIAGGSAELEHTLSVIGSHLGLAFQLQDDLLSVFGDNKKHGKDAFSDLREGKQTAAICFARLTSAWQAIEPNFGRPDLSFEQAEHVRDQLIECGAESFVQQLISEQLTIVYAALAEGSGSAPIPPAVRAVLLDLIGALEGRES